ncbi:MAG TPA: sugar-binding protein [bacterium]|nr:sugar-binding protein [bacterium]HPN43000.1 sugar-binding protein [bacterium]
MRSCSLLVILFVVIFSLATSLQATLDVNSILQIPRAEVPPVIDGEMDPIWYSVTNTVMTKALDSDNPPDDWFDLWGQFKLLYDDENLYGFFIFHDDIINSDAANPWDQDGIELYFDADNSKAPQFFDGYDDVQLRINTTYLYGTDIDRGYGNSGGDWGMDNSGIVFVFTFTDIGYFMEMSIPLADLQIIPAEEWEFGFEIQNNDNDTGIRNSGWRWWDVSNNSWYDPSIFGTAALDDYIAGEVLRIIKAPAEPQIDGVMEEIWDVSPDFSSNTYITQNAYVPDDTWNIYERVDDWNDMDFDFRVMWDDNYFYFFANVRDDIISTEVGGDWEKDGFELYFDGDNSKNDFTNDGIPYDINDKQLRRLFSDTPAADYACQVTEWGWTMEWKIPYSELGWTPEEDMFIGFEVQFNDQDDPSLYRSGETRWWSNDNNSWQDASLFGTAVLLAGNTCENCEPVAITSEATDVTLTTARLNGRVNARGLPTTVKFQYGISTNYSNEVFAINSPLNGTTFSLVHVDISNLLADSLYHFRVVATNSAGTSYGDDFTFTPTAKAPVVTTFPATNVTQTTASVNGKVNANNQSTSVIFQYGTSENYGSEIYAFNSPVSGTALTNVSAEISGLTPNTIYHYRVVATNSGGKSFGDDAIFTTTANLPFVFTSPATNITQSTAILNGYVNPNGVSAIVKFQYGVSESYGSEITAASSPVTGTETTSVQASLNGLTPNTTFHYRVLATNSGGTTFGEDATFATIGNPAFVITSAATNVTDSSATLNGFVNANGISSTVTFQYGLTADYSSEIIAANSPISGTNTTAVSAVLNGLESNVTFHYRVKANSTAGTSYGEDMTFTTSITTDLKPATQLPQQYALMQNYPNPFNPVTNIIYKLPNLSKVKMTILNTQGSCVKILCEDYQYPGNYQVVWDGTDDAGNKLSSGLYFLRMDAEGFTDMRKMMLIK